MALELVSLTPETISYVGGDCITMSGTFSTGVVYTARIGSNSCLSGIAGQGSNLYSYDGATLTAFAPALVVNTVYDVTIHDASGGIVSLAAVLTATNDFYYSEIFSLRSILPSNYALGARDFFTLPNVVAQ